MLFTKLFAVTQRNFGALLAQEVLFVHVLAQSTIEIVFTSVVNSLTRATVIESHLVYHELEWIRFLSFCRTLFQIVLIEYF